MQDIETLFQLLGGRKEDVKVSSARLCDEVPTGDGVIHQSSLD